MEELEVHPKPKKQIYTIDGMMLYEFDPNDGKLTIGTNKKGLENLLGAIGEIPEEGLNLILATPTGQMVLFRGVKEIIMYEYEISPPVYIYSNGRVRKGLGYIFGSREGSLLRHILPPR